MIKTVYQYNSQSIGNDDMEKLLSIAKDYNTVKQFVYRKYGGIRSISKLYPGYTVQNEMTECGLRQELMLPSVYYYLAVFDALGDIKTEWTRVKNKIMDILNKNENFSPEERHYLRYVLKMSQCYEAVLVKQSFSLPEDFKNLDQERLNSYIRRKTRKYLHTLQVKKTEGFRIAERAYRYGDGGIYISTKEKRKRIFIALTDRNQYNKQLFIHINPDKQSIRIDVPVETKEKKSCNYKRRIGLSFGYQVMFTTSDGRSYGEQLGEYALEEAAWMSRKIKIRNEIRRQAKMEAPGKAVKIITNNLGTDKYKAQKEKKNAAIKTMINAELNRMIREEKPGVIYIPQLPPPARGGRNAVINYNMTLWKRGYIRERLLFKTRQQGIEVVEVMGKNIGIQCSRCGALGEKRNQIFYCPACQAQMNSRYNAARNVWNRGKLIKP